MKVIISPLAEKQLKKLHKIDQIAVAHKIRQVASLPLIPQEEKLKGYSNVYRIRVGALRIVYHKRNNRILIILIRHRKDIYKLLSHLMG
jgi:mRNA interferase RelE/StbE